MADALAIRFNERLLGRTDHQTRDILAAQGPGGAEVDTINVVVGDGATVLGVGVSVALKVDFEARITGAFLQEFDGTSGSVSVKVERSQGGNSPVWQNMVGTLPFAIPSGRYYADNALSGWVTSIQRGDFLRFSIVSASAITRILVALRIRRLEP